LWRRCTRARIAPFADGLIDVAMHDASAGRWMPDLTDHERFVTQPSPGWRITTTDAVIISLLEALRTDDVLEHMAQAGVPCAPIRGLRRSSPAPPFRTATCSCAWTTGFG
jgi:crotonobetainyl-CoA:carnitine CoA-transferase CaiB-like acyl-CoA transferase